MDRIRARWWSRRPAASPHLLRSQRGFTLVEALIAAIVLTVALVALADLLAVSVRMHQLGRNSPTAARLAQDKIEELTKASFSTHPGLQVSLGDTLASNVEPYFDAPPASGYTRRWLVQPGPDPTLRVVTVRVIPDGADTRVGAPFTLTTILRSW